MDMVDKLFNKREYSRENVDLGKKNPLLKYTSRTPTPL